MVELLNNAFEPVIVDDLSNASTRMLERLEELTGRSLPFYELDCRDQEGLEKVLEKERPDGVIHFAAYKAVNESVRHPLDYYDNNLGATIGLLKAMERTGVGNLVFSSSCTVYGQPDQLPVTEETPLAEETSPYGETKRSCERMIADACWATEKLQGVTLRYFNPVGAHPSGKIGEWPIGEPTTLVPYIVQTAAGIRDVLTVNGDDYNTHDGTCIRDFIHVMDLAAAHVKAFIYMEKRKEQGDMAVFNVGTGKGNTVMEAIRSFEEISGVALNVRVGPRRKGDVEQIWADVEKARKEMGWVAERTLRDALADAWRWQRNCSDEQDPTLYRY